MSTRSEETAIAPAPSSRGEVIATLLRKLALPVILIAAWTAVTETRMVAPLFLPSPRDLFASLVSLANQLPGSLAASVTMTLMGFVLGTLAGLILGLVMAYSRFTRDVFGGVLDFMRPVPIFALIPLFILWFGLGAAPQVAIIVLGTSLIIGVTTIEAIKNVPPVFIRAALVLGASRSTIYRTVIVPSIVPHLLGAVRVAAATSWGLSVAGEFIGAQVGLGYLMIVRQQYLDTSGVVLIVLIYCTLALLLDKLIVLAERPITRWSDRGNKRGIVASIVGSA